MALGHLIMWWGGKRKMEKLLLILLSIAIILLIYGVVGGIHDNRERDRACEELGLVEYVFEPSFNFCEDIEGNLHYIKMECKPWYWPDCTAKPISVGDVRVR